jgi:hypothetical protein
VVVVAASHKLHMELVLVYEVYDSMEVLLMLRR